MQKIINFIKYHNLVPIILGVVLLLTASAFASEQVRNAVIGEEIITQQGIDNSQILAADLDNFDMALQITNVSEDSGKYYIDYAFRTIAIKDNSWQEVWKEKRLAVSKKNLGDGDLTLYVAEELSHVVNSELAYLKEVQEIEKEKGVQKIIASVEYTGLLGLLSDLKEKLEPVCEPTDEVCDGIDNDCDGLIDEDLGQTTCGTGACLVIVDKCFNGALVACVSGNPSNEICGDGIDNNCDEIVDNSEICQPQPPIDESPVCQPTTEICDGIDNNCNGLVDEDNVCQPVCQPTEEICDGLDNDCNGLVDEDNVCEIEEVEPVCDATHLNLCLVETNCLNATGFWYNQGCNAEPEAPSEPEDMVCNSEYLDLCTTQELCEGASLYWYNEACNLESETPVCEPTDEVCDGIDNDCDEEVDEDLTVYSGTDQGTCQQGITECIDGQMVETQPEIVSTDEICDGLDNDCDGQIDEDLTQQCGTLDIGACEFGTQTCTDGVWVECIGAIEPIEEVCGDDKDNNCDGQVDENCQVPENPENPEE